MDQLITIVNNLQSAFAEANCCLDLPQIAVVGCQSAGKSSVLENLVGLDFLPRGTGIVTRRPLVLQLFNNSEKYAEFGHAVNRRFTDFREVHNEIIRETDRLLQKKNMISSEPILLRIHAPDVLSQLTIVDLPGLTKNAVGDQPSDIAEQIQKLVLSYISRNNCLILAVSPANVDLANSHAIQIACQVDPRGQRTIGVVTKLDIMDQGTNAREILENKILPLQRGYIGMVNRSQKDIASRKTIQAAIAHEAEFFASHPVYGDLATKQGTRYLQTVLSEQLQEHIKDRLPGLRLELQAKLSELEAKLADLVIDDDDDGRRRKMAELVHKFTAEFEAAIFGSPDDSLVSTNALNAGAKIAIIFNSKFPKQLVEIVTITGTLDSEINYAIRNNEGVRASLFTPPAAFEAVVRGRIRVMAPALYHCCDAVVAEVEAVIRNACGRMAPFSKLQTECLRVALHQLKRCEVKCKAFLGEFVDMQLFYINIDQKQLAEESQQIAEASKTKKEGYLALHQPTILKSYKVVQCWCSLNANTFSCFDKARTRKRFEVSLNTGIKLLGNKDDPLFTLFFEDSRILANGHKKVILSCSAAEERATWLRALYDAGAVSGDSFPEPPTTPFPTTDTRHDVCLAYFVIC